MHRANQDLERELWAEAYEEHGLVTACENGALSIHSRSVACFNFTSSELDFDAFDCTIFAIRTRLYPYRLECR